MVAYAVVARFTEVLQDLLVRRSEAPAPFNLLVRVEVKPPT